MHFTQRRPAPTEERILPLINVVFLLLIFFMLAGTLAVREPFEVTAPDSSSETRPETEPRRLLLGADGRLALDGEVLDEAAVVAALAAALADDPGLRVELKADARTPGNRAVVLLEALRAAGLEQVSLMTQARQED
ncbi:biopolymer transporter ExbD [Thioalkalivibrio sp. XN8]|uniref:ExbD/TolR family protein n=1 Tax=Thioalkalivibrio sp. XN8 TaxID=2712863 RepID=UPI0013EC2C8C|nr:biopolymer transporter ExbD [Thioalkalivibrio sp. XN8]NGP51878.1 biopolymer transporter ExbD [Thioalkalivibrio sp. XN8]